MYDTLPKFNMEPENDGSSFSRGWFSGFMLNFRGVYLPTFTFTIQIDQMMTVLKRKT